MNRDSMHVVIDMNAYREERKITRQELADIIGKDISAVNKQITERGGNLQLFTAYEYAAALGGAIKFLTDDECEFLSNRAAHADEIERLRFEVDKLMSEKETLLKANEELVKQNNILTEINKEQFDSINRRGRALEKKDDELILLHKEVRAMMKEMRKHHIDPSFLDEVE